MCPGEVEEISRHVIRPPWLVRVIRPGAGHGDLAARSRLNLGNHPCRVGVDKHPEPGRPNTAEEVEILVTEIPVRVREHPPLNDPAAEEGGAPRSHVHWNESGIPGFRHDVLRMASPHELPPVGHHRTRIGQFGLTFQTAYQLGDARAGKPKESDVILTEVGPASARVGEGVEDAGTEPVCRPEVYRYSILYRLSVKLWVDS